MTRVRYARAVLCRLLRICLVLTAAFWPFAAHAEVLDKVWVPWDVESILVVAGLTAMCWGLVTRRVYALQLTGLLLSAGWGALFLTADPAWEGDIGDSLRMELGPGLFRLYCVGQVASALAPAAVSVTALLRRRNRQPASPVEPSDALRRSPP